MSIVRSRGIVRTIATSSVRQVEADILVCVQVVALFPQSWLSHYLAVGWECSKLSLNFFYPNCFNVKIFPIYCMYCMSKSVSVGFWFLQFQPELLPSNIINCQCFDYSAVVFFRAHHTTLGIQGYFSTIIREASY